MLARRVPADSRYGRVNSCTLIQKTLKDVTSNNNRLASDLQAAHVTCGKRLGWAGAKEDRSLVEPHVSARCLGTVLMAAFRILRRGFHCGGPAFTTPPPACSQKGSGWGIPA